MSSNRDDVLDALVDATVHLTELAAALATKVSEIDEHLEHTERHLQYQKGSQYQKLTRTRGPLHQLSEQTKRVAQRLTQLRDERS